MFEHKQTPDFQFWAASRTWTLDQATLLSAGLDPRLAPHGGIEPHLDHASEWDEVRRTHLLLRKARLPSGMTKVVGPAEFIEWADVTGVAVPQELRVAVNNYEVTWNSNFGPDKGRDERKRRPETEEREKNTLLKMVAGMAIRGYKFNPRASRSPVPGEIADDVRSLGLEISDDTVRKWLHQAADLVERPSEN
jgi:hypothetical protein